MATIRKIGVKVDVQVELILNEDELLALDALLGYDLEVFLKIFYEKMGRAYLEPHEAGLRSLVRTIGRCSGLGDEAKECRQFLKKSADAKIGGLQAV